MNKRLNIIVPENIISLLEELKQDELKTTITQTILDCIVFKHKYKNSIQYLNQPTIPTPPIPTTTQTPYTQIPEQSYQPEEQELELPLPQEEQEEEQLQEQPEELSELELALLSESEEPKIIQKPVSLNKQIQYYVSWFYPIYDNKLNTRESIEKELRKYKIDIKLLEEYTYKFLNDYDHDPVPSVKHLVDLYNLK